MKITKCDLCKKEIKGGPITVWVRFLTNVELCEKCGIPILNFLKKSKIIESNKFKKK